MDVAAIEAMDPSARLQYLGNGLYPMICGLIGDNLAGKVTGMLLEMSTADVVDFFQDKEKLKAAVSGAVEVLPPDMLDLLGQVQPIPGKEEEAASPVSPYNPSPVGIMASASNNGGGWADCEEDEDEMPSVEAMFAKAADKRTGGGAEDGEGMETEETDGFVPQWDGALMALQPPETLCAFIAERLQEPQVRIMRAVVEMLGPHAALYLLFHTERCVYHGGMIVEETGKPRTAGGIFLKLLKDVDHTHLGVPTADVQQACLNRIKKEGADARKAHNASKNAKRNPFYKAKTEEKKQPDSPVVAESPDRFERPKASFGDFLTPKMAKV